MPKNLSKPVITYSKGLDGSWGYWVRGSDWGSFGFASKGAATRDYLTQQEVQDYVAKIGCKKGRGLTKDIRRGVKRAN